MFFNKRLLTISLRFFYTPATAVPFDGRNAHLKQPSSSAARHGGLGDNNKVSNDGSAGGSVSYIPPRFL